MEQWLERDDPENGEWPYWWRQVSLLYGADLAVHETFRDLKRRTNLVNTIDTDTHNPILVKHVHHLHAIHGPRNVSFDKFNFFADMKHFCSDGIITVEFMAQVLEHANVDSGYVNEMLTVPEYSEMIAYRGALEYILQNGCFHHLLKPW